MEFGYGLAVGLALCYVNALRGDQAAVRPERRESPASRLLAGKFGEADDTSTRPAAALS
jgi:hypothetical protein